MWEHKGPRRQHEGAQRIMLVDEGHNGHEGATTDTTKKPLRVATAGLFLTDATDDTDDCCRGRNALYSSVLSVSSVSTYVYSNDFKKT